MHNHDHDRVMSQPSSTTVWLSLLSVVFSVSEVGVSMLVLRAHGGMTWLQFLLDSTVETLSSSIVLIMELRKRFGCLRERDESRSTKAIALSFFILALYGLVELFRGTHELREIAPFDITISVWFAGSTLWLYFVKKSHGVRTHNVALQSDAKQSLVCALSGVILLFTLFFSLRWRWADIVGQLLIFVIMCYEGYRTWQEKRLCC